MKIPKKTLSVILHTLEALIVVALVYLLLQVDLIDSTFAKGASFAILTALFKTVRISDSLPIPDYVNQPLGTENEHNS